MEPINKEEEKNNQDSFRSDAAALTASNPNSAIIDQLKEERDKLRSTEKNIKRPRSKKIFLVAVIIGIAIGIFLLSSRAKSSDSSVAIEGSKQKSFKLPENIETKPPEEKQALNIISLARQNKTDELINSYLNKAQLGQSGEDFKKLINSYSSSADGGQAELVEKKVGKVDFASTGESTAVAETTSEFDAASLIYKSSYYKHTNNLFLKINIYKPDPTVDNWKLYMFEFKAAATSSPLKAELNIPV